MKSGAGDETCSISQNVKILELMRPETAVFETASIATRRPRLMGISDCLRFNLTVNLVKSLKYSKPFAV